MPVRNAVEGNKAGCGWHGTLKLLACSELRVPPGAGTMNDRYESLIGRLAIPHHAGAAYRTLVSTRSLPFAKGFVTRTPMCAFAAVSFSTTLLLRRRWMT